MPIRSSRLKLAVIVVCALLVAGAAVLLAVHRHAPAPGKPAGVGSPSPPVTSSGPASPTAAATSASPSAATSGPATPSPTRTAGPPPKTATPGLALVDGPYGFQVPRGWTFTPLASASSDSQAAHWTDPASGARFDYLVVSTAAIYSVDHTVNLASIEAALPCRQLPPTSYTYLSGKGPRYSCAPMNGLNVNGLVLIKPYPQGFRLLQLQMPAAQDAVVAEILAGFH
ncbi:MAG TPA: hypothetical protein VG779_02220 [Actinomycetota bacterium]|nr:hypothetical protein [Actinomycetota bacterium]